MMEKRGSSDSLPFLCLILEAPEVARSLIPRVSHCSLLLLTSICGGSREQSSYVVGNKHGDGDCDGRCSIEPRQLEERECGEGVVVCDGHSVESHRS